eukprot:TRINITY_DN5843_c0_g4_i1.p1 TRINITY_DN5843_c0_g4~~TRINITY_DN5843_c0_g4_i1.p1  ORF type:complete len:418 (-),score=37.78 TRINITY_DN5843_c0_g4_i1:829-1938(-)
MKSEVESMGKYEFLESPYLGEGGFGTVMKVKHKHTQEMLALKVLSKQKITRDITTRNREEKKKRIIREILHQKSLSGHPLIVELKEVFLTESYICIVMEFAQGGNMFSYVTQCIMHNAALTESEARGWFQQLIVGLDFCHKHKIINRDIKLENTLRVFDPAGRRPGWWGQKSKLGDDDEHYWYLKICDFGYSKHLELNSLPSSRVGSLPYASPEVLYLEAGQTYDGEKRDVWSCGVMLYCLLTGSYPFDPRKYPTPILFERIHDAEYRWPVDFTGSQEVRDLVARMLIPDPNARCSLEEIINSAWFQVDLPSDWNRDFDTEVAQKQQELQTDQEISELVDQVIPNIVQVSQDDELINQQIEDEIEFNVN